MEKRKKNEMEFCYPVEIINIRQEKTDSHTGLDLGFDTSIDKKSGNQNIYSVFSGEVIYLKVQTKGGYVIGIYNKELNMTAMYAHLLKGSIKFKLHQKVKVNEVIAKMGKSGVANGNHLHFELYKGKIDYSKKKNFLNPLNYLVKCSNKIVSGYSKDKLKIIHTKIIRDVPDEPLLVHNKKSFSKASVVKGFNLYNGNEVPVYKVDGKFALIDKVREYYISSKFI